MIVDCYRNLNKKCWSIRDPKTRLVIAHVDSARLENVELRVGEKSRQRAIRQKRRNVHAYARGTWVGKAINDGLRMPLHYNPFKAPWFYTEGGGPVHSADVVEFSDRAYIVR